MELKIHEFQGAILRTLLFNPKARFRDLNKVDITNDHFTFHLKQLIKEGLVAKNGIYYSLTDSGKEFANRMDTDSLKLERQGKLGIAIHAIRIKNNQKEYLIHKRLKEPFYGFYGSQSGKIRWGEMPIDTAKREFFEETGLKGTFKLKAIVHYHNFHKDGKLLEDKYFWVFEVINTKGLLKEKIEEGENIWMTEKEYRKLKNTFATFEEMQEVLKAKKLLYLDKIKFVDNF
ncbi:MAG TPA: NUDIX domain-containing protein [Patescibacteria group bacterium]|nr:NUDIX domain-containing protein [Patescibacteria group bacterium]